MQAGELNRFTGELIATLKKGMEGRFPNSHTLRARVMHELGSYGYALRWEWKSRHETLGFQFFEAEPDRYLGSPSVVRGLVQRYVDGVLAEFRGEKPGPETLGYAEIVSIFSGQDPGWTVIGVWNQYEGLGVAVRHHLGSNYPAEELIPVLEDGFYQVKRALAKVFVYVRGGVDGRLGDDVAYPIDAVVGFTTAVLLGIPVDETVHGVAKAASGLET